MCNARMLVCALALAGSAILSPARQQQSVAFYGQKVRTFHTAEGFAQRTGGRVRLQRAIAPDDFAWLREASVNWPNRDFSVVAHQSAAVTWVGTRRGAIRVSRDHQRVEYFAGLRWLPDDGVTGIGFDPVSAWIETSKGLARIEYRHMTLEEKSRAFVDRVQLRHNRWGLTADSRLTVPGDLTTNQPVSTDNDGLWTAMYVAAEAFRYKVTGAADARDHARRGMQAILRLEAITGIPGFPARSFIRKDVDAQPEDGEWHDTADGAWRWKGDTSSDEIVGHYFVVPIYYDLVADETEKAALRAVVGRITSHIIDHEYQLIDVDGKRTRWGWWGPDAIWQDPDETGLRALHILSHLRVALHVTADAALRTRFQSAYDDLVGTHKYHLLTRNQKIVVPGHINHSDDELAFLSYYPLLRYESEPKLLEVYRESLERSWQVERPERNPLWNFIYAAGTGAKTFDLEESLRTLREIPMDQIKWTVTNSQRLDVPIDPMTDRFQRRQALIVLPYDELPIWKWNGNPFSLDGGDEGRSEGDGVYFLLPYWLGRYHALVGP